MSLADSLILESNARRGRLLELTELRADSPQSLQTLSWAKSMTAAGSFCVNGLRLDRLRTAEHFSWHGGMKRLREMEESDAAGGSVPAHRLQVGARVCLKGGAHAGKVTYSHSGKVTAWRSDGLYDIEWDSGDKERGVSATRIEEVDLATPGSEPEPALAGHGKVASEAGAEPDSEQLAKAQSELLKKENIKAANRKSVTKSSLATVSPASVVYAGPQQLGAAALEPLSAGSASGVAFWLLCSTIVHDCTRLHTLDLSNLALPLTAVTTLCEVIGASFTLRIARSATHGWPGPLINNTLFIAYRICRRSYLFFMTSI